MKNSDKTLEIGATFFFENVCYVCKEVLINVKIKKA